MRRHTIFVLKRVVSVSCLLLLIVHITNDVGHAEPESGFDDYSWASGPAPRGYLITNLTPLMARPEVTDLIQSQGPRWHADIPIIEGDRLSPP